jgi:hypothetical protein
MLKQSSRAVRPKRLRRRGRTADSLSCLAVLDHSARGEAMLCGARSRLELGDVAALALGIRARPGTKTACHRTQGGDSRVGCARIPGSRWQKPEAKADETKVE